MFPLEIELLILNYEGLEYFEFLFQNDFSFARYLQSKSQNFLIQYMDYTKRKTDGKLLYTLLKEDKPLHHGGTFST